MSETEQQVLQLLQKMSAQLDEIEKQLVLARRREKKKGPGYLQKLQTRTKKPESE